MGRAGHFAINTVDPWQPALRWAGRLAAVALAALATIPVRWVEAGPVWCPSKLLFGRECFGCGMTRALSQLMHGDLAGALTYHRASVAVLPVLLMLALWGALPPLRRTEWEAAGRVAWLVFSAGALGLLIAPWVITPAEVALAIPPCEWKARYHRECPLCGMTTAFFEIREGSFRAAMQSNRGSVPLYLAFVGNEAAVLGFMRYRHWRQNRFKGDLSL